MHIYDFLKLYVNRFTIFGKTKIFLGNKTSHKIVYTLKLKVFRNGEYVDLEITLGEQP